MDFRGLDLNLLVAFDALFRERNVTRAAARVGVSQPAMSAALSRLRLLFEDQLFLRSADGLLPTARARELGQTVAPALEQIGAVLAPPERFEPKEAKTNFVLGLSDYPAFVFLPALTRELGTRAPHVAIAVRGFSGRDEAVELLDAGKIDAAIGVPPTKAESRIMIRELLRDQFVTLIGKDHPSVRKRLDMKAFLRLQHVLVSPEGEQHGVVDKALASRGLKRTLRVTLPQMFVVPSILAETDLAATVLRRVALHSSASGQLMIFPPPIQLPEVVFDLIWHRRNESSPAQQWLRDLIAEVASTL
jgi:DNA-binding transcriptional LysR family regulator